MKRLPETPLATRRLSSSLPPMKSTLLGKGHLRLFWPPPRNSGCSGSARWHAYHHVLSLRGSRNAAAHREVAWQLHGGFDHGLYCPTSSSRHQNARLVVYEKDLQWGSSCIVSDG